MKVEGHILAVGTGDGIDEQRIGVLGLVRRDLQALKPLKTEDAERGGRIRLVEKLVLDMAAKIKTMLKRHDVALNRLRSFVVGSDVFAQRGSTSNKTIAADYQD